MGVIKRALAVYMMGVAAFVAVWFIIASFFEADGVWDVANFLMAVGLFVAMIFNLVRNSGESGHRGWRWCLPPVTGDNAGLYLTTGVAILFLRNWFVEIANAGDENSVTTGIVWIVVNVLFPLIAAATGCALWRESSRN